MDKMKMETADMTAQNIERIAALFPSAVTEMRGADGTVKKGINFEVLKQLLSKDVVDGDECYEFTWVGKKAAIAEAARPTTKTLRPVVEDSRDWDTTENLYIEGDNLEVLKILQESYLGKVKMIYIDPPYNTGNDFIYRDDFATNADDYAEQSGEYDEETGARLFRNTESNGRFHSDWCSMIYSRLFLSRSLLAEDGAIFISIDNNEIANMQKVCDDIFGRENLLGVISNINNPKGRSDDKFVATAHEYLLVYAKRFSSVDWYGFEPTEEIIKRYNKVDSNGRRYREIDLRKTGENDLREDRPNLFYYFYYCEKNGDFYPSLVEEEKEGYIVIKPQREDGKEGNWRWSIETAKNQIADLVPKFMPTRKVWGIMQKDYLEGRSLVKPTSAWTFKDVNSERGTEEFTALGFDKRVFPKPKPLGTISRCIKLCTNNNGIIMDFFSGSATTAHAVMQLNSEDGGHRKFIMVQLPEPCEEKSEAYKAGYPNICEIGKERIRRAGDHIRASQEESRMALVHEWDQTVYYEEHKEECDKLGCLPDEYLDKECFVPDIGFRVFRVDDSNMEDIYYHPEELDQQRLGEIVSNIKPDRSDLDLLYSCLLDWGVEINLPHTSEKVDGCTVHNVDNGALMACFDGKITNKVVAYIAEHKPIRVVFRDASFASDADRINIEEAFKNLSPDTQVKVI